MLNCNTETRPARFKILKEMGVDKAVVQTSPMATSLAEKLGFKKYTNYKIYCLGSVNISN